VRGNLLFLLKEESIVIFNALVLVSKSPLEFTPHLSIRPDHGIRGKDHNDFNLQSEI